MMFPNNLSPFSLLNNKLSEQLFDYTEEELEDFQKSITPDILPEVFKAVEDEYIIQNLPIANTFDDLSQEDKDVVTNFIEQQILKPTAKNTAPKVELLDGYIAISASNLQTLDLFKDSLLGSDLKWEHRIKKHGDVTIHSYVINMNEDSK